ncbi:unnamed protein product [Rhizopus microsporus]|uniref:BHLH domain-containing protein n=1 Tax=Rhizopus microsporus TaxID=58291 RepID=A0A1X0S8L7_RHIZD|nr:hypothetical protein BCV71DRAFT_79926 [Rhizopus microsporus]
MIWRTMDNHQLIESKSHLTEQNSLFMNLTPEIQKKKEPKRLTTAYKVNGVNILNRKNLDSKTVIERIQKRRENHNYIERRRRNYMNNTIWELSKVIPNACAPGQKPNKANILKLALEHILDLQAENQAIRHQLRYYQPFLHDHTDTQININTNLDVLHCSSTTNSIHSNSSSQSNNYSIHSNSSSATNSPSVPSESNFPSMPKPILPFINYYEKPLNYY